MKIFNYYKEKNQDNNKDLYLKSIFYGILLAVIVLTGGKILIVLVGFLIEYWIWAVSIVVGLFLLRRFMRKKRIQPERRYY